MKTALFLGEHKNLFPKLVQWLNDDQSLGWQVKQHKLGPDQTRPDPIDPVITPDLIFCIYSAYSPAHDFWTGIEKTAATKVVRYGRWLPKMMEEFYFDHDHFATMATQEKNYVPAGKFTYLLLPLDLTDLPDANMTADRPTKVMQGYMPMRSNKQAYLMRDACAELGITYEVMVNMPQDQYFQHLASNASIFIDQCWRGEIGMVTWEALAMGLPVICYVSDDTKEELTRIFGSVPPIISPDFGPTPPTEEMTMLERDQIVKPAIKAKLEWLTTHKEEAAAIGRAGRDWIQANYTKQKVKEMYVEFFNKIINQ